MNYLYLILFLTIYSDISLSSDNVEISYGTATDKHGVVVYREKHTSEFSNENLEVLKTEYSLDGKVVFGYIQSNFSKNPYVPTYQFEDKRHDRFAGIKWIDNKVVAFAKKENRSNLVKKNFEVEVNTVAGQGLHNYLRLNIEKFYENKNKVEKINFLIPMSQEVYSFRIRTKEIDEKNEIVMVRIEADSWLIRIVAPHIDVKYDVKNRRLLEYKGPSNLLSEDKENMNVTIVYQYPPKSSEATK